MAGLEGDELGLGGRRESDREEAERQGISMDEAREWLDFRRLSQALGLHKDSFNYMSHVQSLNRI